MTSLSDLQPARGARCLITGCALYNPDTGTTTWGDLHVLGDMYIFNAVPDPVDSFTINPKDKMVTVYGEFFERRQVWVFSKSAAVLNLTAENYINASRF